MDEPPGGVANGPQQAQAVQGDGQPQEGGHPQPQGGAQDWRGKKRKRGSARTVEVCSVVLCGGNTVAVNQ